MKFSGSPKILGEIKMVEIINRSVISMPKISLEEKYGWNGILSKFELVPNGLLEPVSCKNSRWIITIAAIINGRIKWKAKNRFKVALSTANPPQIHSTSILPRYGIAESKLVITVAPQNDIWPHGKTYPMKAVIIVIKRIKTPIDHVSRRR